MVFVFISILCLHILNRMTPLYVQSIQSMQIVGDFTMASDMTVGSEIVCPAYDVIGIILCFPFVEEGEGSWEGRAPLPENDCFLYSGCHTETAFEICVVHGCGVFGGTGG